MKFTKYIVSLFYLVLLFSNCVEEFNPPSQGYENLLVVEAFLSDSEDPFEVKLSRSIPIDTSGFAPESGAKVQLAAESGETFSLYESGNVGIYTYPGAINAQVGQGYKLQIQTRHGSQYESSVVTLRETPDIDSVRFEFQERPNEDSQGIQFYTNTHDPSNGTWYYRWVWDETWQFRMPYDSYIIYEDDQIKQRDERINVCWKYGNSTSIEISTSKNLTEDRINDFPLLYVSTKSDRLKEKYSLNVKQYALSEESYNYLKELQKFTENLGTLFDPQPSVIKGNIYNVNDETEIVLGYFDAATEAKERVFVTRRDFPYVQFPNYYEYCEDSIVSGGQIPAMVDTQWWLVEETVNEAGFPAFLMSWLTCIDCRIYGSNVKPDYWD